MQQLAGFPSMAEAVPDQPQQQHEWQSTCSQRALLQRCGQWAGIANDCAVRRVEKVEVRNLKSSWGFNQLRLLARKSVQLARLR